MNTRRQDVNARPFAATPVRTRRRWVWLLLLPSFLILLGLISVGCAVTCTPTWYQPAAIDYERLESDKRALTETADRIGDELNARRPIRVEIDQEQLNRWITARREVPGGEQFDLPNVELPFVSLMDGNRVRVAATLKSGGWRMVVSITGGVALEGELLRIRLDEIGAGRMPVPSGALREALRKEFETGGLGRYLQADGSLLIPNDLVWPNGKKRCRVQAIEISAGKAVIELVPN